MKAVLRRVLALVLFVGLVSATPPGAAVAAPTWRYTALGDSLAVGLWAFQGYVPRYRSYLQTDTGATVSLTNLGRNGWTSTDLLNALQSDTAMRKAVHASRVVTWDIGGNDLLDARSSYKNKTCGGADNQDCLRGTVATFEANWDNIIVQILHLRATANTIVRTMDIYNPYVGADQSSDTWPDDAGNDFVVFKSYLDQVNQHIAATATSNSIPYAEVYLAFNGPNGDVAAQSKGYISFDGLHPNDIGHKAIADRLRALEYAPLH
jgi:lysophospholipase L1-like esterase